LRISVMQRWREANHSARIKVMEKFFIGLSFGRQGGLRSCADFAPIQPRH